MEHIFDVGRYARCLIMQCLNRFVYLFYIQFANDLGRPRGGMISFIIIYKDSPKLYFSLKLVTICGLSFRFLHIDLVHFILFIMFCFCFIISNSDISAFTLTRGSGILSMLITSLRNLQQPSSVNNHCQLPSVDILCTSNKIE